VGFTDPGRRLLRGAAQFVYRHINSLVPGVAHDGHARRLVWIFAVPSGSPACSTMLHWHGTNLSVSLPAELPLGQVEREWPRSTARRPAPCLMPSDHIAG